MHAHPLPPLNAACFQGVVTAHSRAPGQRSRPIREASLGLGLTSALSGDRAVGLPVARHLVWGRGCRARSRRIWRSTGTASAAGPLGLPGPPDSILGNQVCAGRNLTLRVLPVYISRDALHHLEFSLVQFLPVFSSCHSHKITSFRTCPTTP